MSLGDEWFTEKVEDIGCAFSLRIKDRLHYEQSRHQKIEVYQTDTFGRLLVLDGCTMVSDRESFIYHEMMVHPAVFSHGNVLRVVIIGGGDCGVLREVLKHSAVKQVAQIDIDERVTRVSEEYFPDLCSKNADPRVQLVFQDGLQWMLDADANSVDVIIVDSTDPAGPGEALFDRAFHEACLKALAEGGLLVQQSESPLLNMPLIERIYGQLDNAGYSAVRSIFFPAVIYPGGWWSATLALKDGSADEFSNLVIGLHDIETRHYCQEIHRAAFAEPRFFSEQVRAWREGEGLTD
jgi:spermidine synthase